MSKESVERGLVLAVRPKFERLSSRSEESTKRGTFVPEASDIARFRVNLRGAARRS